MIELANQIKESVGYRSEARSVSFSCEREWGKMELEVAKNI